jgi:hypothetical protein
MGFWRCISSNFRQIGLINGEIFILPGKGCVSSSCLAQVQERKPSESRNDGATPHMGHLKGSLTPLLGCRCSGGVPRVGRCEDTQGDCGSCSSWKQDTLWFLPLPLTLLSYVKPAVYAFADRDMPVPVVIRDETAPG